VYKVHFVYRGLDSVTRMCHLEYLILR